MYKEFLLYSNSLNVLFVENDENIRDKFSNILQLFFNRVDTASDGIEGLHLFREFYVESDRYYDIVITEMNLPTLNGEQLIKEIKVLNKNQVFVLVSDCDEAGALSDFIKLGVNDFLTKPFSSTELEEVLYKLSKKLSSSNVSQNNYTKEDDTIDKTIELLRFDDSICLRKVI